MSCGKYHETDCSEVLEEVWLFLDHECDGKRRELLARHLDECDPCLERFGMAEHLKEILGRKCGGDHAPDALKERLRGSLHEAMVEQCSMRATSDSEGTTVEYRRTSIEVTEEA